MEFLSQLTVVDMATLSMSALALVGGVISTAITLNAKYYEDQRQLRMTAGDLTQKLLTLRAEEQLLNIKALRQQEGIEEFTAARDNNMKSQHTLARLMMDTLEELKRPATAAEYEVLAAALTSNGDPAGDKYWRLAIAKTTNPVVKRGVIIQFAYALTRYGRQDDGEHAFKEALALAGGDPYGEGHTHETRARALHAALKPVEAKAAFEAAEASYNRIADPVMREFCRKAMASARATVGV